MKLDDFYQRIAPFLLGETNHDAVVPALWGKNPPEPDASRLAIYGRFCQNHRAEPLDGVFPSCRRVFTARLGEEAWTALVEEYCRAHPMHHFEINRNAEYFADFLAATPRPPGWPPFLGALADVEWWEWQVYIAADDDADATPDSGPLRIGSTVELRPYDWDLVSWLDALADADNGSLALPADPEAQPTVVLFWRDRDLDGRRATATPLEMMIIKALVECVPLDDELCARLGVPYETLSATAADLHNAGILLGDPGFLPAATAESSD